MAADITILINAHSGGGAGAGIARQLRPILEGFGKPFHIEVVPNPRDVAAKAREAARRGSPVVAAGGGDGTINAVVNGIAGTGAVLGVLPLGTLNHFAKDMKIPLDLAAAAAVLVNGRILACDLGEVNGRLFVNNSSIGLYPSLVRRRQRVQKKGYPKGIAKILAALTVLRNYSLIQVSLDVDGQRLLRRAPLVFIGNNEYIMSGFSMGARQMLCDGRLSLHIPHDLGPWELILIGLKALTGRLRGVDKMDMLRAREILVSTRRMRLAVAFDGEVEYVRPPLRYRSLPGALRLMVPAI